MSHFGLDIGSQGLRLVELKKEGKGYRVVAIASSTFSGRGLVSEAEKDHQDLAGAIKKLVVESKVETRNAVVGLPESSVFSRLIETPPLTDEELSSSITWEAEQYIPVPLDEVTLDWEVVSRPAKGETEKKMEVFLVAAPTRLIGKYTKILNLAGLVPAGIETESIALSRGLVTDFKTAVLLVDFGSATTDVMAVKGGKIVLTRSIPTGGVAFTRAVKSVLKIEEGKAEEYKRTYGLTEELEGKIKKALNPLLQVVIGEVKKSIDFYDSAHKDMPLNMVILSGGTAKMPEMTSFFTNQLGLEVQVADPFALLIKNHLLENFQNDASLFSVAVGLAMKEV